ncbi:LLM class flavin-dependent oxidoreductase [Amycolatopsis pigmentata]|uniref:LLM class flavin-dependent oxidoreductase n=1 Tax=Amycolatopsis pigmentata TaxID=450801 RepID=A0ABW5G4E1_9PSEU
MNDERPFRLGFLSHVASVGEPRAALRETLRLFVIAEELGLDSAWVVQHHVGAERGHLPSPFVFMAAVAERTSRIRLGAVVVTLPLEHPVRVAEDAAVADLLSGGRLEVGIGTSGHERSFTALGTDFETRRERNRASADELTDALANRPLPGGERLTPRVPGLVDRLWRATSSESGVAETARAGHGLLLARSAFTGPTRDIQPPLAESYLSTYRRAGHTRTPRIGVTRSVYPAASREQAVADLEAGARDWTKTMAADRIAPGLPAAELFARHHIIYGHISDVVAALWADRVLKHATDLLVQVQPGLPGFAKTVAALETIATEVAPALGWHPA